MGNKVYVLQRVLAGADGKSQMTIPVQAYATADLAEEAMRLRTDVLRQVLRYDIYDGPKNTGITVAGFLQDLGLHGFNHVVDTVNVVSTDIVVPQPTIIIPR